MGNYNNDDDDDDDDSKNSRMLSAIQYGNIQFFKNLHTFQY